MDSFFGVGFPDLILILVFATLILGPHRMRDLARTSGRLMARLQRESRQFMRMVNAELDQTEELRDMVEDVRQIRQEIARDVAQINRQVQSLPAEFKQETRPSYKPVTRQAQDDSFSIPRPVPVADDPE
jgi:sec-independent protein translocase protein TatB